MDTVISGKSKKNKYVALAIVGFLIFSSIAYAMISKERSLNVKQGEIAIKEVRKDYFEDFIVFQAKVEPLHSMLINIIEGGAVQEIFVENGAFVEKGEALVRLYNPNKELNYMTQETSIIEQINNLNKARLDIRNQELNLTKDLVSIEHDFTDAKNQYNLDKKRFKEEILSKNDWIKTQENYRYQQERKNIIQQTIQREKQTNQIQVAQINSAISTMEKSLEILRENKENFLISAPLSGRLSSFEPILGKTYITGNSIGKIDVMKGYKLVAEVDEYYLDRIKVGQHGSISHQGKAIEVTISNVIPEVKNGKFQVELNFKQKNIMNLQQGISFGVQLVLSERETSVIVPKGSFYTETSGKWIFVLEGDKAVRKIISLGRENPLYYEVLDGLNPGDKVITSSYQDYTDIEILNIEK